MSRAGSDDIDRALDVIIAKADALRRAGVLSISIADVSVSLSEYQLDASDGGDLRRPVAEVDLDPIDDPDTYGGVLPGFRRPQEMSDDA